MFCMVYIHAIKGVNVLKRKQAITAIKTHFIRCEWVSNESILLYPGIELIGGGELKVAYKSSPSCRMCL